MFCPKCGEEYSWDVMVCPTCDVDTVDGLQDLFGLGRVTGFSFAMGPAEFWVREDDANRARELLKDLTVSDPDKSSHDA